MPPHAKKPKETPLTESEHEVTLKYGQAIIIKNSTIKKIQITDGALNIFGTEFSANGEEGGVLDFSAGGELIEVVGMNMSLEKKDTTLKMNILGEAEQAFTIVESNPKFMESVFETFDKIKGGMNHVRVLIVGQTDSGKSTLSRILFNHALFSNERDQEERICAFADIDVGQNQLSIPGSMSMVYELPSHESYSKVDSVMKSNPLATIVNSHAFNFGDISPKSTIYYDHICKQMTTYYDNIIKKNADVKKSMWIINTCGWVEGQGYELIKNAISSCNITHVISFDPNTTRNLERDTKNVVIIPLEKSSHVKKRSTNFRKDTRAANFNSYFSNRLNTLTLPLDKVKLCMIDYKTQNSAVSIMS